MSPPSLTRWPVFALIVLLLSIYAVSSSAYSQSHATVLQFLPPRLQTNQKQHHPVSLTPSESRLVFSTIFGVSRFHTMGFVGQFAQVLDLQRLWKQGDLFEQDKEGSVVLTVAGVVEEHADSLIGKKAGSVLFRVSEPPHGKTFLDLTNRMMSQRSDILGESGQRLYANTMGGEIVVMPSLEVVAIGNCY
jgi:hypothetical protein